MRSRNAWIVIAASLLAAACGNVLSRAGIPGTSQSAKVEQLGERGPFYLDVKVETGGREWRYFLPNNEECKQIIAAPDVRYVQLGPLGSLRTPDGGLRCDPNGVLSLVTFRDQTERARPGGIPSGLAQYDVTYRDDDLALAVGMFPMVGYVGWTGGSHTVAVIPNDAACSEVLARTVGTIEYRASGPMPLSIVTSDGRCPLLGLARAE